MVWDPCFLYTVNWQWVLTNYFFTKKEKPLLKETKKLCGSEMDFCSESSVWHCCDLPTTWSWFGKITFKKPPGRNRILIICSTDHFCLITLTKDDKTVDNMEGKKDFICFRTDVLWMSLQYPMLLIRGITWW